MNKEKSLRTMGSKTTQALQASMELNDIIVEKYLSGILPETRQISMAELNEISIYDYFKLKKYLGDNYYEVKGKNINVIADNQYLAKQSKDLCKRYVLKLIVPAHYDENSFESRVGKFITDIDFTTDERNFIDLILNEIMSITSIKEFLHPIAVQDLCAFNAINQHCFYFSAKRVYNDILQKKLHAGDNLMPYLAESLTGCFISDRLTRAEKFDLFFDKDGILKCDLDTNINTLIKNFINSVIYSFADPRSRVALLQKLNAKYPIFVSEGNF